MSRQRARPRAGREARDAAVRLRAATPGDAAALAALEQASFTGDRMSARQFRRHLSGRNATRIVVAERGGELLGDLVLFFRAGSDKARLYSIVVAAAARGLGLGRRLLRRAEAEARRGGARELMLEVRQDNRAAIALYEADGYRRFGARARYYDDGADAWRYRKTLA